MPSVSKGMLCGLLGVSRQAHHQTTRHEYARRCEDEIILGFVRRLRERQGKVGARKIQLHIEEELFAKSGIRIGRDALFDLLRAHGLLVRRRAARPKTTDSGHHYRRYPNLVKGMHATAAHQILVSDLTYVDSAEGFVYLFLVTDAYSRKVVGHHAGTTMEGICALSALRQAIGQLPEGARPIHHSDRGSQYACTEYTHLLVTNGMPVSMTEDGNPLENCMAERVNGLVKELIDGPFPTKEVAVLRLPEMIKIYNEERKHGSIGMLTPAQAHVSDGALKNLWKKGPAIVSV